MNGEFRLETAYIDGTPVPVCITCGSVVLHAYRETHMSFHAALSTVLGNLLAEEARAANHEFLARYDEDPDVRT